MRQLLRELERVHPGLKRSLLGALSRVDLGWLPIPGRPRARPGDRLPVLEAGGMVGPALAAAFAEGCPGGG